MSEILLRKSAILQENEQSIRNSNAPHTIIGKVTAWISEGKVTQSNLPNKPFEKPYSQSYVGGTYGKDGTAYVDNYWGSTHDGCRSFEISGDVLTLSIYDGNSFSGAREGLRGTWEFDLNFDWTDVPEFNKVLSYAWECFVADEVDRVEADRLEALRLKIESALLEGLSNA